MKVLLATACLLAALLPRAVPAPGCCCKAKPGAAMSCCAAGHGKAGSSAKAGGCRVVVCCAPAAFMAPAFALTVFVPAASAHGPQAAPATAPGFALDPFKVPLA